MTMAMAAVTIVMAGHGDLVVGRSRRRHTWSRSLPAAATLGRRHCLPPPHLVAVTARRPPPHLVVVTARSDVISFLPPPAASLGCGSLPLPFPPSGLRWFPTTRHTFPVPFQGAGGWL